MSKTQRGLLLTEEFVQFFLCQASLLRYLRSLPHDLLQVLALRYPVFTSTTICSHADCHILHIGLPVRVGGVTIATGELLHGDANGVTQIPLEIAADVADAAAEFVAAERIVLDYVQSGQQKSIAEFVERSEAMSAAMTKLRNRVRHPK